jgi:hypothetical protein
MLGRKSPLVVGVEMGLEMHVSSMIHAVKFRSSSRHAGGLVHLDLRCPHGLTLLHISLAVGNANVAHVLLVEAGSNVWAVNEETAQNVFHFAAVGDNPACLGVLLAHLNAPEVLPEDGGEYLAQLYATGHGDWAGTSAAVAVPFPHNGSSGLPSPPQPTAAAAPHASQHGPGGHLDIPSFLSGTSHGGGAGGGGGPTTLPQFPSTQHLPQPKIQFGCRSPTHGSSVGTTMGFGQAIAKLREYVPTASADPDMLTKLEAAVDNSVAALRQKSLHTEVDLLHQAITIVSRRLRLSGSKRSIGGFYGSTPAMSHGGSSGALWSSKPSAGQSLMARIREAVNAQDASGMTPLHYAIECENTVMCHVLCAYGAVFSAESSPLDDGDGYDGAAAPTAPSAARRRC